MYPAVVISSVDLNYVYNISCFSNILVFIYCCASTKKTTSKWHIRGYSGREQVLAPVSDYWTSTSHELTPRKWPESVSETPN